MDERECCGTCLYYCEILKHPTFEEVTTKACLYHPFTDRSKYVLETTYYDMCECYKRDMNERV